MTTTPAAPVGAPRLTLPTTAAELLAAIHPFGVAVEGEELVYAPDLPPELAAAVGVLQSGLRARLTGRKWVGCGSTAKTAAPVVLNPCFPVPEWVTLLAVEGDARWDRVAATARTDFPELFER